MLQQTTAFYSTYFEYIFTSLKIKAGREKMDWDREERERESERDFAKYLVTDSKGRKILFTCFFKASSLQSFWDSHFFHTSSPFTINHWKWLWVELKIYLYCNLTHLPGLFPLLKRQEQSAYFTESAHKSFCLDLRAKIRLFKISLNISSTFLL